jgi:Ca-activated chloride channel family protein
LAVELDLGAEDRVIEFELLRPAGLALCLCGALVLLLGLFAHARRRSALERLIAPHLCVRFLSGWSPARMRTRTWLAALGALALGLAAVGPVRGVTWREVPRRGIDLVLCVDTSRSMLAQDQKPDRLSRAKREIRGLLEVLGDDRCAIVAFSGDARDVAPLTRDRATLAAFVDELDPRDNQRGGTDIAAAIQHALELFDGRTGAHEAIVLLTDGEDLAGRGTELAEEAARRGIRVYVVGVGTQGGGKIPVVGPDGKPSFLAGPDGAEVVTRMDEPSLRALAERALGAFLSVEASPTPLEDLYRTRLSRLAGQELEGGRRRIPHDRYQWPLSFGLSCWLVGAALRERRRTGDDR